MVERIFVNLPVTDLPRQIAFFEALGFSTNPHFTNETAACVVLGETMFAMLLTAPFFSTFTDKAIADAHRSTEVLVALQLDDRAAVDAMVEKARAAGARIPRPASDLGFMYQHAFEDPDGHIWEVFWMDAGAVPG